MFTAFLRASYGLFTGCLRPLTKGPSYSGRGSSGDEGAVENQPRRGKLPSGAGWGAGRQEGNRFRMRRTGLARNQIRRREEQEPRLTSFYQIQHSVKELSSVFSFLDGCGRSLASGLALPKRKFPCGRLPPVHGRCQLCDCIHPPFEPGRTKGGRCAKWRKAKGSETRFGDGQSQQGCESCRRLRRGSTHCFDLSSELPHVEILRWSLCHNKSLPHRSYCMIRSPF